MKPLILAAILALTAAPAFAADLPPKPTVEALQAQLTQVQADRDNWQALAIALQAQRNAQADQLAQEQAKRMVEQAAAQQKAPPK